MKEKLSVTIITLNEEYNIRRCIESVLNIADEIIVVDSGSTDETESIVKELGACFIYNKWPGHKEQKNFAIEQTNNEWILSLDADEWLDDALSEEIDDFLNQVGLKKADEDFIKTAFEINRKTMFVGEFVDLWSPDWIVRLFNKNQGCFGGTNPHDFVILNDGISKRRFKNYLYHESFRDLSQYFVRTFSYARIAAFAMRKEGRSFKLSKLLFSPPWAFFKKIVFQSAWKDGFRGMVIAVTTFYYVFTRYAILWDLERRKDDGNIGLGSTEHQSR